MIRPLELFIALRYARSRATGYFVSFITWVSLLGVALGVAALITVLSIMNGFEGEIRDRLLSLAAHATLARSDGAAIDGAGFASRARALPGVTGAAPVLDEQALLSHGQEMSSATLRGIDPTLERTVSSLDKSMIAGSLAELTPGSNHLVLGRALAYQLGVSVGDELSVMVPTGDADGGLEPRVRVFTIVGLFEVGIQDNDGVLALADVDDVVALSGANGPTALRLRFTSPFDAPAGAAAAARALGPGLIARDWTIENSGYFRAIRIEKTMMTLILLLVAVVAAFNIVATLVMVVRAKRTDIAILRTLGLAPRSVVAVFLGQGTVIGWIGTAFGAVGGTELALHAGSVAAFLEHLFNFQIFDASVYYMPHVPSEVQLPQVLWVTLVALAITLLATVYPALRAARTEPADALRYE